MVPPTRRCAVLLVVAAILLPGRPAGAEPARYDWPVPAAPVRDYDAPASPFGAGHRGVDLPVSPGQPVHPMAPGLVVHAGAVAGTTWVTVRHDDGVRTSYGPLRPLTHARLGDRVAPREAIGAAAGRAHGTGGRLHVGARRGERYVDPASLVAAPRLVATLVGPGRAGVDRSVGPRRPTLVAGAAPSPNRLVVLAGLTSHTGEVPFDLAELGYPPGTCNRFSCIPPTEGSTVTTLSQLADEYLTVEGAARSWAPNYIANQRSALDAQILPQLGGKDVGAVTRADLAKAVSGVRGRCSAGYATLVCGALRRLWQYGADAGHVAAENRGIADLSAGRAPRRQGQSANYVDPKFRPDTSSVTRLAEALPWPYDLASQVSAWSGLRFGETFALEAQDVDLDAGMIHVERQVCGDQIKLPKYDKTRDTIIPDRIVPQLARRLGETRGLMFPTVQGLHVHRSNFYTRVFRPACVKAGWPRTPSGEWLWSYHGLRHHFCVVLLASGVPLEDVAMFAGHSSPAVTLSTYVGVREGAVDRARELLGG